MKLLSTSDTEVIKYCQGQFGFDLLRVNFVHCNEIKSQFCEDVLVCADLLIIRRSLNYRLTYLVIYFLILFYIYQGLC